MYSAMAGLGDAEQDALNAIRDVWSVFLGVASQIQRWRNSLTIAGQRGADRNDIYDLTTDINNFEADYRALRARMFTVGSPPYLAKITSGTNGDAAGAVNGILNDAEKLQARVNKVAAGTDPFAVDHPTLSAIFGTGVGIVKWVAIGAIAYAVVDLSKSYRSAR